MPANLKRYHRTGQSHFSTFTCYHRLPRFADVETREHFITALEKVRVRYGFRVYGFVIMPEHVHLLISEPERAGVANAIQSMKISCSKRCAANSPFWQKHYYDRNVRDYQELVEKLRYVHRNPMKRGLVENPGDWNGAASGTMRFEEIAADWTAQNRIRSRRIKSVPHICQPKANVGHPPTVSSATPVCFSLAHSLH